MPTMRVGLVGEVGDWEVEGKGEELRKKASME